MDAILCIFHGLVVHCTHDSYSFCTHGESGVVNCCTENRQSIVLCAKKRFRIDRDIVQREFRRLERIYGSVTEEEINQKIEGYFGT